MDEPMRQKEVTDDEIVVAVMDTEGPFATAEELSERLPMSRQGINNRLRDLQDQGLLKRKQCGSGYGWWVVREPPN